MYMQKNVYVYVQIYINICIFMYANVISECNDKRHLRMVWDIYTYIDVYLYMYIYIYVHVYVHIYINIYICMYIYICICVDVYIISQYVYIGGKYA